MDKAYPAGVQAWTDPARVWRLSEFDIFRDLSPEEMDGIARSAPMREVSLGTLLISPGQASEVLFILKKGRVRLYRLGPDGRSLTTAIIEAGQLFGEMLALGQQMDDAYAEALDRCVVCVMSREDVHRLMLSDPRIASRIAESLGARVAELERRLGDTVLKSVPARIASALAAMAGSGRADVRLTHEQLADLVGTSRETTTKVLGDLKDRGLVNLRRGRITVIDPNGLRQVSEIDSLTPVTGGPRVHLD
ncbi:MAG: cyclic nucleotide-binding domain-containing protein [Actinomycetales bacterium]|nr:cyclic nucleotide-binding domain-containing protein [Actinomycetales bacterium]